MMPLCMLYSCTTVLQTCLFVCVCCMDWDVFFCVFKRSRCIVFVCQLRKLRGWINESLSADHCCSVCRLIYCTVASCGWRSTVTVTVSGLARLAFTHGNYQNCSFVLHVITIFDPALLSSITVVLSRPVLWQVSRSILSLTVSCSHNTAYHNYDNDMIR